MVRLYTVATLAAATAKTQNTEYFSADLVPDPASGTSIWYITIAGTAVDLQVTYNSGTTWDDLVGTLTAATITTFTIYVRDTDLMNFRSNEAAGITIDVFRVDAERS